MTIANNRFFVENTNDKTQPPAIFLHGAGGSSLSWPPALRSSRGNNFYFPDLPGHGKSEGASPRSIEEMAKIVLELMDSKKIGRAILFGHSMGGAIALWLATHHPGRLLGLGLFSTAAKLIVNPFFLTSYGDQASYETLVHKLITLSFSDVVTPRVKDLAEARLTHLRPTVLQNDFIACSNFDLSSLVTTIDLPTLIVSGSNDQMIPCANSYYLNSRIRHSECHILDGGGHMILLEQPEKIVHLIGQFIKKIPFIPGAASFPQ